MLRALLSLFSTPVAPGIALWQVVAVLGAIIWIVDAVWRRAINTCDRRN
ncbi:hypothetical protein JET14_12105 [Martelella lutilitoris]|uniref:Uncharacterized protein n=1 Tax=Martelella lutilitoris TaxID=2583532 RepID=A0A7T7HH68_9HYPH|nr:hypothetical protein [Martelella lutilitoris]QQM29080.1 hypothetical protein JET14_12105 [Martelella lutilitoris]